MQRSREFSISGNQTHVLCTYYCAEINLSELQLNQIYYYVLCTFYFFVPKRPIFKPDAPRHNSKKIAGGANQTNHEPQSKHNQQQAGPNFKFILMLHFKHPEVELQFNV